jgi:DNA (cytosine-5)-methyltransferase 1
MRVLDLFSGIGGFSLGLERSGMRTVAFCEIDPYCRAVLAKHWPGVPCYDDARTLTADRLSGDGVGIDLISAGFPCQNISIAGDGSGLAGEQSGLWTECARLVCELRPNFLLLENVSAICSRGLGDILAQLSDVGYDAEWEGIPAAAIGAVHLRAREWVLAYPSSFRDRLPQGGVFAGREALERSSWWDAEPGVRRVDDGVPSRVDRLRTLGNAVVPQIPELIGRAIMRATA